MNCPQCNSSSIAKILWGYPADMDSLKESLEKKEIVLGGCIVTENDPKYECNECNYQWNETKTKNNLDKIDSFDFDQGFNLDEVYDQ